MDNPTLYIFINKSLGMSTGKVAAQAAHAAAYSMAQNHQEDNDLWLNSIDKTVIVLEARDEAHIRTIKDYLRLRGVNSEVIIDEGVNEVDPMTITALSVVFMDKNDAANKLFGKFHLYRDSDKDAGIEFLSSLGFNFR